MIQEEETKSIRQTAVELSVASFIVLFQELALIRWFPGQLRVLAYFPNLILISAFLGLGLGCLLAKRRSLLWLWPVSLLVLAATGLGLSGVVFSEATSSEYLWLLYYDLPKDAPVVSSIKLPIVTGFLLSAMTFVPLGQVVARRLMTFREKSSLLWGYSWDLIGSLAGVLAFSLVSHIGLFPFAWFAVVLALGLVFFRSVRRLAVYLPLGGLVIASVILAERASDYSPYYALSQRTTELGVTVSANGSLHQYALPLDRSRGGLPDYTARVRSCYQFPYQQMRAPIRRALVLGAGTGNDVAVLLDQGAQQIDAVEIDPVIVEYGKRLHPSRPYDSDRVRIHVTDARSFLNDTRQTYDLIVFGTLDSMTRLSALSNIRLDNFVYTTECIETARERLAPDGGMVMMFMVAKQYIHEHIVGVLYQAFGQVPVLYRRDCHLFNHAYLAGPAFAHLRGQELPYQRHFLEKVLPRIDIPSDDWPFLYLEQRGLSGFYLSLIAILAALAAAGVLLSSGDIRKSLRNLRTVDLEMFLFGAAFLLLETTFVTSINLIWGATWITSAVVFGSILGMVLLATVIMQKKPINWPVAAGGLILSLLVTYFVPVGMLLGRGPGPRLLLSVLYVGAPVFFASACFALRFRIRVKADLAIGWNLLGAVAGGLLEFLSMLLGFKALSLLALCFYLGVTLLRQRQLKRESA